MSGKAVKVPLLPSRKNIFCEFARIWLETGRMVRSNVWLPDGSIEVGSAFGNSISSRAIEGDVRPCLLKACEMAL